MLWRVFIGGTFSGIIESNYAFASKYWQSRAQKTGACIKLKPTRK